VEFRHCRWKDRELVYLLNRKPEAVEVVLSGARVGKARDLIRGQPVDPRGIRLDPRDVKLCELVSDPEDR
jgi:hypothetical protein